ncbi:Chaperone protein DnaJ [Chlorella vulgaris]
MLQAALQRAAKLGGPSTLLLSSFLLPFNNHPSSLTSLRCAHQATRRPGDLYRVVGCPPTATAAELKSAFRKRAKQLHPDAASALASKEAFAELLAAYQVLSQPRSRQLYDLSDGSGPSILRAAAAGGVPGAASQEADLEVDLSWGLGGIFKKPASSGAPSTLDQVRQNLQGELQSAVRQAYLGPRLQDLHPSCLPDAFEADERAAADCPDLLRLVSGRQLLGYVRERRLELLARQAAAAAALSGGRQQQQQQQQQGSLAAVSPQGLQVSAAVGLQQQEEEQAVAGSSGQCQTTTQQQRQRQRQQQQQRVQRDADVLDLYLGDEVVATAVRNYPPPLNPNACSAPTCGHSGAWEPQQQRPTTHQHQDRQPAQQPQQGVEEQPPPPPQQQDQMHDQQQDQQQEQQHGRQLRRRPLPAQVVGVYGRSGELQAQIEVQELDPGSSTASSARLLSPAGRHTHTVFRTHTPLVRHLTFAAELSDGGRLVVCRARRAWLPPSSLWLFKPLAHSHDIGGWCFEWAGHKRHTHAAWLHPTVLVLVAAFDSLDHERQGRQPLGLFARVKAAVAAQRAGRAEAPSGWRGWLSSALRFHGRGKGEGR